MLYKRTPTCVWLQNFNTQKANRRLCNHDQMEQIVIVKTIVKSVNIRIIRKDRFWQAKEVWLNDKIKPVILG